MELKSRTLLAYVIIGWLGTLPAFSEDVCVNLSNNSAPTLCAEEDNVNIPLYAMVSRFVLEATHPQYDVTTYDCPPNFANCPPPSGDDYEFTPAQLKLYDNGIWVVWAYRESRFWRPHGMTASRIGGSSLEDTHYIAVSKKVSGENSWAQFLVLYADGNLRLIPHPPPGHLSVCFGASVIIGPAEPSERPIAEISSVGYQPSDNTLTITYYQEWSAQLNMSVDRTMAVITVDVNYPTKELPFTTFRSMLVDEGNCDTAKVALWNNGSLVSDCNVLEANQGFGDEFVFYREVPSAHNMSAPDIKISDFFKEIIPDLNGDFRVDLFDYAWLASHWLETNCGVCKGADLTCDGNVDWDDLKEFTNSWLAGYTSTSVDGNEPNLIAHWTMDDNAPNTTVVDSSGNDIHGAAQQNTYDLHVIGKIDGALSFNGTTDYIDLGAPSSISSLTESAVAAWIRPDVIDGSDRVFFGSGSESIPEFLIEVRDAGLGDKVQVNIKGGAQWAIQGSGSTVLNAGQWYHVVFQQTGSGYELYVNGSLEVITIHASRGSVSNTQWISFVDADEFYIGKGRVSGVDYHFDGAIDDVMIFDTALSPEEIEALYNEGSGI